MPLRTNLRFFAIPSVSLSIAALSGLCLCAAAPNVARADGQDFAAHHHGDAFDSAGAAPAQFAIPPDDEGLAADDDPAAFPGPVASHRPSFDGFFFDGGAPPSEQPFGLSLSGASSNPIDLGIGRSGDSDANSSDDPSRPHNGASPKRLWPFRTVTDDPVSVPEPSSLLMLGCGIFAVGLKRKYQPAK